MIILQTQPKTSKTTTKRVDATYLLKIGFSETAVDDLVDHRTNQIRFQGSDGTKYTAQRVG